MCEWYPWVSFLVHRVARHGDMRAASFGERETWQCTLYRRIVVCLVPKFPVTLPFPVSPANLAASSPALCRPWTQVCPNVCLLRAFGHAAAERMGRALALAGRFVSFFVLPEEVGLGMFSLVDSFCAARSRAKDAPAR